MAVAVAELVAVPVAVPVFVLVPVGVLVFVLVPVEVLVADLVAEALWVCDAVSEPEIDHVAVELDVDVEVPVGVDVAVDVPVAVEVAVDVDVAVEVDVAVPDDSPTVCVSVAIGMTIQLVPSEIANRVPPISSPDVEYPMLSAVRSLKMTNPPDAPATNMPTSAVLTNRFQLPLFTAEAAGRVNVTCADALRVVNTDPKSFGVTV